MLILCQVNSLSLPMGRKRNNANHPSVHAKTKIAKKARPFDPNRKPKGKCFKCG